VAACRGDLRHTYKAAAANPQSGIRNPQLKNSVQLRRARDLSVKSPFHVPPPDPAEEFVFLLARHERPLGAYVMTMVPHAQDADDILQEAKVIMWRHFAKFEPGTNFGAWARKIAFHQVLAHRKRKQRDRLDFSEDFLRAVAEETNRSADHLERRERVLHDCLAKLPADHREVLHLRYHEGLSLEEMAPRLDRTVGAIYRLLSRVRHCLHDCVTKTLSRPDNELSI
jgi:RNA polymerase sigma-70 factor, ECF subfamily